MSVYHGIRQEEMVLGLVACLSRVHSESAGNTTISVAEARIFLQWIAMEDSLCIFFFSFA